MVDVFKKFKINSEQVIYPKYAGLVGLTSILFLLAGVTLAEILERIFPSFGPCIHLCPIS